MGRTVDIIKKQRKASQAAKEKLKEFNRMKKAISAALHEGPMTVPQIAEKIKEPADKVLFYLMTMYKFGMVEVDSVDDMDEYYLYRLTDTQQKK